MRKLLLPLLAVLALPTAANAGLEEYLVGSPTRRSWDELHCGYKLEADNYQRHNRGKSCTISFAGSKMIVNGEYEITRDSITHTWVNVGGGTDFLIFVTFKRNGQLKTISIATDHGSRHSSLWNFLNLWIHSKIK